MKTKIVMLIKILVLFLPWKLRRMFLVKCFGYEIHPSARIGMSWVYPKSLFMGELSRIDHFTVIIHLDSVHMGKSSFVGRSNWITGYPSGGKTPHFSHVKDRHPSLFIGEHSAITRNHHVDCTSTVKIGRFVTIAGYSSQILTHSIDLIMNRQDTAPIEIGDYCFIGTDVVILGGSRLPPHCVLGAKSLLNKSYTTEMTVYAGVPARPVKEMPGEVEYFHRTEGFVW